MRIAIDQRKYHKRIISLSLLSLFFFGAFVMLIIMNIIKGNIIEWQKVVIGLFLLVLLFFTSYLLRFYIKLKKEREFVMEFENGIFNDYSKPFNRALNIKIEDVKAISFWTQYKGILQYKIETKESKEGHFNSLINQLKGKDFYINDYLINTEELKTLVEIIIKCL